MKKDSEAIDRVIYGLRETFEAAFSGVEFFLVRNEKLNEEIEKEIKGIKANQKKRKKSRRND